MKKLLNLRRLVTSRSGNAESLRKDNTKKPGPQTSWRQKQSDWNSKLLDLHRQMEVTIQQFEILDQTQQHIDETHKELQQYQKQLSSEIPQLKAHHRNLKNENQAMVSQIRKLARNKANWDQKLTDSQQQVENQKRQLESLELTRQRTDKKYKELKEETIALNSQIRELTSEKAGWAQKLADSQHEVEGQKRQLAILEKAQQQADWEYKEADKEHRELKRQNHKVASQISQLKSSSKNLQKETKILDSQIQNLTQVNADQAQQLANAQHKVDDKKRQLGTLEQARRQADKEYETLKQEVVALDDQAKYLERDKEIWYKRLAGLQQQVDDKKRQLELLKKAEALQQENETLDSQIQSLRTENSKAYRKVRKRLISERPDLFVPADEDSGHDWEYQQENEMNRQRPPGAPPLPKIQPREMKRLLDK